jgi:hypothetical protein
MEYGAIKPWTVLFYWKHSFCFCKLTAIAKLPAKNKVKTGLKMLRVLSFGF